MFARILLAVLVLTAHIEALDSRFCAAHYGRITKLRQEAAATPFCRSYLSIGTRTIIKNNEITVTAFPPDYAHLTTTQTYTLPDLTLRTTLVVTKTTTASAGATILRGCYSHQLATKRYISSGHASIAVPRPTNLPTEWPVAAVSLACSCLFATTTTITPTITTLDRTEYSRVQTTIFNTVTSTTTVTCGSASQPTRLSPEGLRFGVFEHRVNAGGEDIAIPYDIAESTVLDSGTIQNLNFDIDIPSQTMLFDGRNMTAKWRGINAAGYFVARSAGTYTFSSPREEFRDEGFFWHGDVAYDRWGDQNFIGGQENYDYMVDHDRWISGAVSITLSAGQVMPIRYIWVNAFASYVMCVCDTDYGSSRLWITTPEGEVVKNTTGWFIRDCSDATFSDIVNI